MPSFLARLRTRAISLSTTAGSAHSNASPTTATTFSASPELTTPPPAYVLQPSIERKIIPDMAQFMDTYAREDSEDSTGLKPPRARRRSMLLKDIDSSHVEDDRNSKRSLKDVGKENVAIVPSADSSPGSVPAVSNKKQRSSRFSCQLSSVSPWSTFGRHHSQDSQPSAQKSNQNPTVGESRMSSFDSTARRSRKSKRTGRNLIYGSLVSMNEYVNASHSSDINHIQSLISTPGKKTSSKPGDEVHVEYASILTQSPNDSLRSTRSRSLTTRSTHSAHSQHVYTSTPTSQNHGLGIDSPQHTFGNPSPGSSSHSRSRSSARHSVQVSPPPPLPSLNHPAFVSRSSSRSQYHIQVPSDATGIPRSRPEEHGQTFPPRRLRKADDYVHANSVQFPPAQLTFGRHVRLRTYSSLPKVQNIFRKPSLEHSETLPTRRRSKSESSRRSSAEWSAHQASAGVGSPRPSDFGWPAEVAHQIVAMSLGQPAGEAGRMPMGTDARADRVAGANRSESTLPCSQVPSRRPIPPLLQPPVSIESLNPLEAVERDGGRHLSRPHSRHLSAKFKRQYSTEHDRRRMQERDVAIDASDKAAGTSGDEHPNGIAPISGAPRSLHESQADPVASTSQAMISVSSPQNLSSAPFPSGPAPAQKLSNWRPSRSASEPGLQSVPETPAQKKGKRKAEEVDITPPDHKQHTTFVLPESHRPHNISETSRAPSSFKRARLSTSSPDIIPATPSGSAQPLAHHRLSKAQSGSWASRTSRTSRVSITGPQSLMRAGSVATSSRSAARGSTDHANTTPFERRERRKSASEISFPISAIVTPHAPSISRSSNYHMRDPRRPPKVHSTEWSLRLRSEDEDGSPLHAWCFFIGFVLFPIWWVASFLPTPRTREVGGTDTEKAVTLDDPQVEHDARTWRIRCRVVSLISIFTYIPFIVLVAIFAPR